MSAEGGATGGADSKAEFPGVNMQEDKREHCSLILTVENLDNKKRTLGGWKPKDDDSIKIKFSPDLIDAQFLVRDANGDHKKYQYKKEPPEPIDDKKSKWSIHNERKVKLKLVKKKPESWERYRDHLQSAPETPST